ncbi:MAG: hypothetical protein ACJAYU_000801 [Bradymonadia bacterium]|jgi:hypothetical protein
MLRLQPVPTSTVEIRLAISTDDSTLGDFNTELEPDEFLIEEG